MEPTSLYKYFDETGILIYVGITKTGILRNRQHNDDKEWWPFVSRQEVCHFQSREEAAERERFHIRSFAPPFNKAHNRDHEVIKAAYLALRRTHDADPMQVFTAHRHRFRFGIARFDASDQAVDFLSEKQDWCVMRHVVYSGSIPILDGRGQRRGFSSAMDTSGGFVRIHAEEVGRELVSSMTGAWASLRVSNNKGGVQFQIKTLKAIYRV